MGEFVVVEKVGGVPSKLFPDVGEFVVVVNVGGVPSKLFPNVGSSVSSPAGIRGVETKGVGGKVP